MWTEVQKQTKRKSEKKSKKEYREWAQLSEIKEINPKYLERVQGKDLPGPIF